MNDTRADIMIVGVGGQGVILAATVIAEAALLHGGLEVKESETHGMSQRGGSVQAQIRIGKEIAAPVISPGEVDYLLAFEVAEGLRWAPSVADGGVAIVNTERIVPPIAATGTHSYPHDALERMRGQGYRLVALDASALGEEAGSAKVAGVVLLGALSNHLSFAEGTWRRAIESTVKSSWLPINLAAFAAGQGAGAAGGRC
jgi:indolepyruvate ferredoxin oxidoreductase, beta subunit